MTERSAEKQRIGFEMFGEQIDSAPVQRHRRGVRIHYSVLFVQFEDSMLGPRLSAIGLEHYIHGCEELTLIIVNTCADTERIQCAFDAQGICGPTETVVGHDGITEHG